ncbi:MAG: lysophospholipid acyltransferase family protein [Woeseiaceae bacterium]|nr:lysophospholipid acyltransferase family protein [Woeseiaceae bacterium]
MNWVTRVLATLWGLFVWLAFGVAVLLSLIVVLIVPSAERRQKFVTWAARMTFVLPRFEVHRRGLDNLPTDNCIVVANHASYLDGVLLKGYLPWRFNFVIKGEMRDFAPAHFLLRRGGSRFVERTDVRGSSRDARQIVKAAQSGESLGFFPEGTFQADPGILRFRPGAFVAAKKGDLPVVPIAIRGSRYVLPAGRLLPRRGPLHIDILPAIAPGDAEFETSRGLAEAARQRILAVVDEPDLRDESAPPYS